MQNQPEIECIHKTCFRVILGDMYVDFLAALEMCGITTLWSRREKRYLDFSIKCVKREKNNRLFPLNIRTLGQAQQTKESLEVNWARTETYRTSTIPYCQTMLNSHLSA